MVLDLLQNCIETAARRAQRRLLDQLLDADSPAVARGRGGDAEVEARLKLQLELVQDFLRSTDFSLLRAEHPALRGGSRARVLLERTHDGAVCWSLL